MTNASASNAKAGAGKQRKQEQLRAGPLRPQRQARPLGGDVGDIAQLQGVARRHNESLLAARKRDHDDVVQARRAGDGVEIRTLVIAVEPVEMDRRGRNLPTRKPA